LTFGASGYLLVAVERPCADRVPIERMDTVRRLVFTGVILAALAPAAAASATTPPEPTDPAAPDTTATTGDSAPSEGAGANEAPVDTATVYDESGNPVATITYVASETAFSDYEEGNDPEAGSEYVRVQVTVESLITEGTFNIGVDDFILQSNNGFVTRAENVLTAAQAEADEEVTEDADLANGEALDLALTFEVVSSVGPQSVFYSPDDDRLVDVAELA
jgi:hypothetical protein